MSNPAIAVTVVIDNPTVGASKYGGAVSAPVFAQVAQQVLEYLGVPHDQPLTPQKLVAGAEKQTDVHDDAPSENTGDLDAMFADVNNLPADDPLRKAGVDTASDQDQSPAPSPVASALPAKAKGGMMALLPKPVLDAFHANGGSSAMPDAGSSQAALIAPKVAPAVAARGDGSVVVDSVQRVAVPSFDGAALRSVVEQADRVGLRVNPVGSGLARQQYPAAGTMVPVGTQVSVRFSR